MIVTKPSDFGLPARFDPWRQDQERALWAALDDPHRCVCICAPTGFGKSLTYVAMAKISGRRTAFLTATKGLQDQLAHPLSGDFTESGLCDIRGMNNYECAEEKDAIYRPGIGIGRTMCDEGPCHVGHRCQLRDNGCLYFDAVKRATQSRMVMTNYDYWFSSESRPDGPGLGAFDMLVCDEAHEAPLKLASFLNITLTGPEISSVLRTRWLDPAAPVDQWRGWGEYHAERLADRLDILMNEIKATGGDVRPQRKQASILRRLLKKLLKLADIKGDWVAEEKGDSLTLDPLDPRTYGCVLHGRVAKVILVGATVRRKTAQLLGIADSDIAMHEYRSSFAVSRRPVYAVPTITLNRHTDDSQYKTLLARIDQLIAPRLGYKGIIHTISYARANMILASSAYAAHMIGHDTRTTRTAVDTFKHAAAPRILVSPSVTTGWDFPDDECRWQIILKVPFPDTSSRVMRARVAADKEYSAYLAMQDLVQASGRGNRSAEDWCETFILDDSFMLWFMPNNGKKFAPLWWREAVKVCKRGILPEPLKVGVK